MKRWALIIQIIGKYKVTQSTLLLFRAQFYSLRTIKVQYGESLPNKLKTFNPNPDQWVNIWLSVSLQTASSTYELVKWSPYVLLKFFMKILNLLTIIDKKHPFLLFETSKSWNCWPFYPTGTMSRIHTFEKRQCDTVDVSPGLW